jgi:hypothetical protein
VLVLPNDVGRDEVDATGAAAVTEVLAFCCLSLGSQLAHEQGIRVEFKCGPICREHRTVLMSLK